MLQAPDSTIVERGRSIARGPIDLGQRGSSAKTPMAWSDGLHRHREAGRQLTQTELPRPKPGARQTLVRVLASGVRSA